MPGEKIQIKNMVCNRCIMVVETELNKLGIKYSDIALGEVALTDAITEETKLALDRHLRTFGFELIDDKKHRLVEKVKNAIVDIVHYQRILPVTNLSAYISEQLNLDYNYISNLFSEVENVTIGKYYTLQRIERVKELLTYDEYTLSEIADQLQYSSIGYLSNQFKKVTGISPTAYKQQKNQRRNSLDKL
jgi:AraC-like DNA-binding protein